MSRYEDQANQAAELAHLEAKFMAAFLARHPGSVLYTLHDSVVFESLEAYELFSKEREEFLSLEKERQNDPAGQHSEDS